MVVRFAGVLAIVGLLAAIVLFGLAVWSRRKALIEIVKSVQVGKEGIENWSNGQDELRAALAKQSPATKKIVKKIKEKFNATPDARPDKSTQPA